MKCTNIEPMISGFLDNELTQQEQQRVQIHLDSCESCAQEFKQLQGLKEQIASLEYPTIDSAELEKLEQDLLANRSQKLGWSLIAIGWLGLTVFGLFMFFQSDDVPVVLRILYGFIVVGGLSLFISVLRQRLITYKNDKYRKVKL
jgi:predicted anti-sigma-YlaC factor YlaD